QGPLAPVHRVPEERLAGAGDRARGVGHLLLRRFHHRGHALGAKQPVEQRERPLAGLLGVAVDLLLLVVRRRHVRAFEAIGAQQIPARLQVFRIRVRRALIRGDGRIDVRRFRAPADMPLGACGEMLVALVDLSERGGGGEKQDHRNLPHARDSMAASASLKKPTFFIVDGSNNVYRSYFAIRGLTNSAGLATNAVYGFTTVLRKMLKDHNPDLVAVAFDISGAKTRHEAFADYKKDRRPMPDDLAIQLPFVDEVLEGFGIPVIGVEDWEADDLIGSLACLARDRGYDVVIATSDKDFFQLVGDGIKLYHTGREVLYDAKGVEEAFGLPPEKVVDVMAIWGDAIDNIPGVPGIGEKGAKGLIQQFGSLDGVYGNLDQIKKAAQRKALEDNREKAYLSRDLASIKCDLALDTDFD